MPSITGQCLCGKVRYSVSAEPEMAAVCHCADCRRHSGAAFAAVISVPKSAVSVEGPLRTFRKTGDSGRWIERQFCPECGSSVLLEVEFQPGQALVQIGTLDDATPYKPVAHLFCDAALPWTTIPEDAQRFARMPG